MRDWIHSYSIAESEGDIMTPTGYEISEMAKEITRLREVERLAGELANEVGLIERFRHGNRASLNLAMAESFKKARTLKAKIEEGK